MAIVVWGDVKLTELLPELTPGCPHAMVSGVTHKCRAYCPHLINGKLQQ